MTPVKAELGDDLSVVFTELAMEYHLCRKKLDGLIEKVELNNKKPLD